MTPIKLNIALKTSPPNFGMGRLIGVLFFFLIQISFAQPDNNKQEYYLNDPRNPDCPCHKYQKMADDEFKKLQKNTKAYQSDEIKNEQQAKLNDESERTEQQNKLEQHHEIARTEKIQNAYTPQKQLKENKRLSGSSNSGNSKKQKRKIFTGKMHKFINFFTLKLPKTRKVKPIHSICFKW